MTPLELESKINWEYTRDYPISGALGYNSPFLSEISSRDAIFSQRKCQAISISNSLKYFNSQVSAKIFSCCSFLDFRYDEQSTLKLFRANFCKCRICPICIARKSDIWQAKAFQNLPRLKRDQPNLRFLFLTLTIKNCSISNLSITIDKINAAWKRMTIKSVSNWADYSWPALGYVKSIEVTKGKNDNNSAHPHIHALLLVPENYFNKHNYIQHHRWREIWQKSLMLNNDYLPFVNIKAVAIDGEFKSVLELLKYEIKISDLNKDMQFTVKYLEQVKGHRFISCGGLLRQYFKFFDEEDLLNGLTKNQHYYQNKSPDLSFNWNNEIKQFTL
jgi:plasmid rolling circle replication initiator protein Rep